MKEERCFKLSGRLEEIAKESFGDRIITSAIVSQIINDKRSVYKISLWDDGTREAAFSSVGQNVLILGRLQSLKSKTGFWNVYLQADSLFVEPQKQAADNSESHSVKQLELENADIPF